jgi:hydroxymethylpyrimidine/phosphomethylpyrimidine kinase
VSFPPVVLVVAGLDSSGAAGLVADVRTLDRLGVHTAVAATMVSAQDGAGVRFVDFVAAARVAAQIRAAADDYDLAAVKVGALGGPDTAAVVAGFLAERPMLRAVVDPVWSASSGDGLGGAPAREALARHVLPVTAVLTPNLPEAEGLLGRSIGASDVPGALRALHALGPRGVVLKGGHLAGDAVDWLFDGEEVHAFAAPRLMARGDRGTGCTFASALTAGLAHGRTLVQAVREAKAYVREALEKAPGLGRTRGPLGRPA